MSENLFSIRSFRAEDRPQLTAVFRTLTPHYFGESEEADLHDHLEQYGDLYYVLEIDGELLGGGGIIIHTKEQQGRLSWTFLHKKTHGKGAGYALIRFLLDILQKDSSLKTIEVWTSQRADTFFERFGFQTQEVKKDYWAPGLHLYRMGLITT